MDKTNWVKTSGKEYYYMVSGLMVPKYMVSESLIENIELFVDWIPKNTKKIDFLFDRNMVKFKSMMEELYIMLCSIHAHWLEMEAARILRLTEINERDLCRELVVTFIANLHTLALDTQMAQNQGFETSYRQRDEIERCRGTISSLKVVATLMESQEFEKALDMVISISELHGSEYYAKFMNGIGAKNVEYTTKLIDRVIEDYTKKIDSFVTSVTNEIVLKKLLLVDDMPEILAALSHMLKGHYQIFAFSNSKEALNFIDNKEQPDAFLLDVDMPEMDGFSLAKKIRERPQYRNTPIVFLTGNSTNETLTKSILCGAKAFIVKPANKNIIISKLSSCLN